jgi:hypothetical protein
MSQLTRGGTIFAVHPSSIPTLQGGFACAGGRAGLVEILAETGTIRIYLSPSSGEPAPQLEGAIIAPAPSSGQCT